MSEKNHEGSAEAPAGRHLKPWMQIHAGSLGLPPCEHTEERCADEDGYFVIYCAVPSCNRKKMSCAHEYVRRWSLMLEALHIHDRHARHLAGPAK
jgi:hypothetical protein